MTTSTQAVAVALVVNCVTGAAKAVGLLLTGSTAIMAELLHSVADITTQVFLVVGIVHSRCKPDHDYPYGFGRSQYVWALLSAAGVLFVGTGVSVVRRAQQVWTPEPLAHLGWGFIMLFVSLFAESVSLAFGLSAVRSSAKKANRSLWQYLRSGPDPMGVAVSLEDASAVLGVAIAVPPQNLTRRQRLGATPGFGRAFHCESSPRIEDLAGLASESDLSSGPDCGSYD